MRAMNGVKILQQLGLSPKGDISEDFMNNRDDIEQTLEKGVIVGKQVQVKLMSSLDFYKQAHLRQTSLSSMTLGVLTSSIY